MSPTKCYAFWLVVGGIRYNNLSFTLEGVPQAIESLETSLMWQVPDVRFVAGPLVCTCLIRACWVLVTAYQVQFASCQYSESAWLYCRQSGWLSSLETILWRRLGVREHSPEVRKGLWTICLVEWRWSLYTRVWLSLAGTWFCLSQS